MQILKQSLATACICNRQWIKSALELLEKNRIERNELSCAIMDLREEGRGKGGNVLLTGLANCQRHFCLTY